MGMSFRRVAKEVRPDIEAILLGLHEFELVCHVHLPWERRCHPFESADTRGMNGGLPGRSRGFRMRRARLR